MQKYNLTQLRSISPCYDPSKYLPENWEGTAIDILNVKDCPIDDRIWVICHNIFLTDKHLRLFAVWCARQALAIPGNESEVCSNTCDVAERFANGNATQEELAAARDAAWAAAWAAARDAARDAAGAAAGAAARDAAGAAARDAARDAAGAAARDAARDAQKQYLINLFQSF